MSEFRRAGGDMVPHRKPAGRRVLLQYEVDLCNAVGLNEEEYWFFVEQAEAYNGTRSAEYEHIPDIQNELTTTTAVIVNLLIGVALTAVSILLAPKPRQPKTPPSLQTDDATGRSRFTPQNSFGSLQELATIGSIIPLVFADKGVRVNSTLLWSQLLSRKSHQELKAVVLLSHGRIAQNPDFEGFAIGDTLLKDYPNGKFALYFNDGGPGSNRLKTHHKYPQGTINNDEDRNDNDIFSTKWHEGFQRQWEPIFSGARTPASQTEFGVYSPFPNGMRYKVNYELVLIQESLKGEPKDAARAKRRKVRADFPIYAALVSRNDSNKTFQYQISGEGIDEDDFADFGTWGTEDVRQAIDRRRIDVDEALSSGEQYTIGSCLATCITETSRIWEPGTTKTFTFKVSEHFIGPSLNAALRTVEREPIRGTSGPFEKPTLLRATVGAVTNNRACDATEIGLKSVVWRKINGFPNVNTQPDDETIEKFEEENGSITLGGINKYVSRLSFFLLQARPINSNSWTTLGDDRFFVVRGQSPREQYNYIRIYPSYRGQYEYRFVPVGGNYVYKEHRTSQVFLLDGVGDSYFADKGYRVFFTGEKVTLSDVYTNNLEWIVGPPPKVVPGKATTITPTRRTDALVPGEFDWVFQETRYELGSPFDHEYAYIEKHTDGTSFVTGVEKYWDGRSVRDSDTEKYEKGDLKARQRNRSIYEIKKYNRERTNITPSRTGTVTPSGGSGSGLTLNYSFWVVAGGADAAIWDIRSGGEGYRVGDRLTFQIPGYPRTFAIRVAGIEEDLQRVKNLNPQNAIADYYMFDAEEGSHFNGPEHSIAYVNELQRLDSPATYDSLAIAGIRLSSGKEWTSFGEFSAYIKKGIKVDRLNPDAYNTGYITHNSESDSFPEIAYALLTNSDFGAGDTVGKEQVDAFGMAKATKFCEANGFYWNGVISEPQNLREFIFKNAAFNLLDFTIKGGRFSLMPSVPYGADYKISPSTAIKAKALFTDGNIRKMQVSFLTPEERQMFTATALYRDDIDNGFPEIRSVTVTATVDADGRRIDPRELDKLPEETFDMSGFCKSRDHAIKFAKYALLVRKHVSHGIKFETTPQAAMGLEPGDYFFLVSEATHTSRFNTGSVAPDGTIFARENRPDGNYPVLHWEPGKTTVQQSTMTIRSMKAVQAKFFGGVFCIRNTTTTKRMYKVETLSYAEEGLVEVSGSETPLSNTGRLRILEWGNGDFSING